MVKSDYNTTRPDLWVSHLGPSVAKTLESQTVQSDYIYKAHYGLPCRSLLMAKCGKKQKLVLTMVSYCDRTLAVKSRKKDIERIKKKKNRGWSRLRGLKKQKMQPKIIKKIIIFKLWQELHYVALSVCRSVKKI